MNCTRQGSTNGCKQIAYGGWNIPNSTDHFEDDHGKNLLKRPIAVVTSHQCSREDNMDLLSMNDDSNRNNNENRRGLDLQLLLGGDIESNPGPPNKNTRSIKTYQSYPLGHSTTIMEQCLGLG